MLEQMTLELPDQPARARRRIVCRARGEFGRPPDQLALDFTAPRVRIPRRPIRSTVCAGATPVTRDGVTLPAAEWADRLNLNWSTVKMRRMRGANWAEALAPELRKTTFMSGWRMHG